MRAPVFGTKLEAGGAVGRRRERPVSSVGAGAGAGAGAVVAGGEVGRGAVVESNSEDDPLAALNPSVPSGKLPLAAAGALGSALKPGLKPGGSGGAPGRPAPGNPGRGAVFKIYIVRFDNYQVSSLTWCCLLTSTELCVNCA